MKELSMHILDIAQNSVRAKAHNITIIVKENIIDNLFEFSIKDDGTGIPKDIFEDILNPFTTSRTMRKVGLGLPLLDDTCNLCNGNLSIETIVNEGTALKAVMEYNHIDRPPMGDIVATIAMLITSNSDINIKYIHYYNDSTFDISTKEIKEVLGDDIPLTDINVIQWLKEFLKENIDELNYEKA
ncbi:MAG: ATP-binding protein [Vallitalea sp.]|jgi:hypothetical protein|nr:ATP-binding protein [Vallitalea sp.]